MADVRSMLRNERAARRINHPQAQYTPTGALTCKACRVQLKSDTLWQSHMSSSQHVNALRSLASGLMAQNASQGKKRKAEDEDNSESEASRKRNKPTEAEGDAEEYAPVERVEKSEIPVFIATAPPPITPPAVDEDEWAAFEREMARESPTRVTNEAQKSASATISAAPISAAELAAKSKAEHNAKAKERRENEIEDEKEDAQRRLEEEFDEMEELEARVKRLKDQREALRQKTLPISLHINGSKPTEVIAEDDSGDDEDYDDWDIWGGR